MKIPALALLSLPLLASFAASGCAQHAGYFVKDVKLLPGGKIAVEKCELIQVWRGMARLSDLTANGCYYEEARAVTAMPVPTEPVHLNSANDPIVVAPRPE